MKPNRLRAFLNFLTAWLLLVAIGCSYGITVRKSGGPDLYAAWRASVSETDEVSPRTLQTLRRWDLETEYRKRPLDAFLHLHEKAVKHPDPDLLFALAEFSYTLGKAAEKHAGQNASGFYYLCAGYAYHYLFPACADHRAHVASTAPSADIQRVSCGQGTFDFFAYDPRFRLACDLYNTGLAKCIRAAQRVGRLDPRQELQLPTPDGQGFALSVVHHGFLWKPEEFGPLLFAADYEVVGLANHYRGFGLGVSLIGTRNPVEHKVLKAQEHNSAQRFPGEVSFPVSAFFRFEGTIADLRTHRGGRLELYNPLVNQVVTIAGRQVPLETDLTTPLAYFLSRTDLEGIEYKAFLHPDMVQERAGIYMFEPYQPGKIPVLMVHGLWSSPLTWTTMFNDLRGDPRIRDRYQFWFYLYPTGNPYLATAADLRQTLLRLRAELDPHRRDPALDHMVLVGHSMGGLVSKLLTVESSADFWRLVSDGSFNSLKVCQDTRNELQQMFFFEPLPSVERVIFLATPHHGSKLSPSPPVRLAARFIKLPKRLMRIAGDLAHHDPQALSKLRDGQLANSIDLLAPGSPALELLAARPKPQRVHFHSIIAETFGSGEASSDGVVPYTSSHLDGVDSEILVPANHLNVHHHPRSVLEVWRILQEHYRDAERYEHQVQPIGHQDTGGTS